MINVRFIIHGKLFRNIVAPSDIIFIELIRKLSLCEQLNVDKIENLINVKNYENIYIYFNIHGSSGDFYTKFISENEKKQLNKNIT